LRNGLENVYEAELFGSKSLIKAQQALRRTHIEHKQKPIFLAKTNSPDK